MIFDPFARNLSSPFLRVFIHRFVIRNFDREKNSIYNESKFYCRVFQRTFVMKKYVFEIAGCTACGDCVEECRFKAIEMTDKGAVIDQAKCRSCGMCYEACAHSAVHRKETQGSS